MNKYFARFAALTAAGTLALLAACGGGTTATRPAPVAAPVLQPVGDLPAGDSVLRSGYACCNLHYAGDLISDSNLADLPFIAAGTPIKIKGIDGYRAYAEIDGKLMRFALDHGRQQESTEQWVNKLVVVVDPKTRLAGYPPAVRKAIEAGKLLRGMTREQVIMAIGYPQADENPRLDGRTWRYWWSGFSPFYVYWVKERVSKLGGEADAVSAMTYKDK